jgi:hypothetical protein
MPKKNNEVKITDAELAEVKNAIHLCWQVIAHDVQDCAECDNEQAIECCIDADRLHDYSPEADKIITRLAKETSYNTVMKFLSRKIPLV